MVRLANHRHINSPPLHELTPYLVLTSSRCSYKHRRKDRREGVEFMPFTPRLRALSPLPSAPPLLLLPPAIRVGRVDSFIADGGERPSSTEGCHQVEGPCLRDGASPAAWEVVLFTNFHKRGFRMLASDFLHGFLCEHDVQLHHLPPNAIL